MRDPDTHGIDGEIAVLDSEIADLEDAVSGASPFLSSWRVLAAGAASASVATLVLEMTSSYTPEIPAIVAGVVSFVLLSWVLSIPDRRRLDELEQLEQHLIEKKHARQRLIADGASSPGSAAAGRASSMYYARITAPVRSRNTNP